MSIRQCYEGLLPTQKIMKREILLSVFFLIFSLSCFDNQNAKRNLENSKRLKLGMSFRSAIEIMGDPKEVRIIKNNQDFNYNSPQDSIYAFYYESPTGASGGVEFYSDSLIVLEIFNDLD